MLQGLLVVLFLLGVTERAAKFKLGVDQRVDLWIGHCFKHRHAALLHSEKRIEEPHAAIDIGDLGEYQRVRLRVAREVALGRRESALQRFLCGGAATFILFRIGAGEHTCEKFLRGVGTRRLPARMGGICGCNLRLPQSDSGDRDQTNDAKRRRDNGDAVPFDESAAAIGQAIRPRADGLSGKIAPDVFRKSRHRRVALVGIFFQRFGENGVDVADKRAPLPGLARLPLVERRQGCDTSRCIGGNHTQHRVFKGAARVAFGLIRCAAGEQAIEHHPERVHVGGSGQIAFVDLLRRGIGKGDGGTGRFGEFAATGGQWRRVLGGAVLR